MQPLATRKQFQREMELLGATLDEAMADCAILQIDAPKGKVFRSNGGHTIVVPYANRGGQSWLPQAYGEALEMLKHGLEDCDAEDCDVCKEAT